MSLVLVKTQASSFVVNDLSHCEIQEVVGRTVTAAESLEGWRQGKSLRRHFQKNGRYFAIALDNRRDGYFAFLGLPQEVIRDC